MESAETDSPSGDWRREALKKMLRAKYKKPFAEAACRSCALQVDGTCRGRVGSLLRAVLYDKDSKKNVRNLRAVVNDTAIDIARVPCAVMFEGKKAARGYREPQPSYAGGPGWLVEWENEHDK